MNSKNIFKKLSELNNTLKGIQTTSAFFLTLKDDAENAVKFWHKSYLSLGENGSRKLTYLYLVNDILQTEKKQGNQFMKAFHAVLPQVYHDIAKSSLSDPKIQDSVTRLIQVWSDRKVYPGEFLQKLKKLTTKVWSQKVKQKHLDDKSQRKRSRTSSSVKAISNDSMEPSTTPPISPPPPSKKEKKTPAATTTTTATPVPVRSTLREELELQLQKDRCEPPETIELSRALEELQNAPSADAIVRKQISGFPTSVSDVQAVQKIRVKSDALRLLEEVEKCDHVLVDYNERLENEMSERKKVSLMLRAYLLYQDDKIKQSESRLEEYKSKLENANKMRDQLNSHLSKLPDLSLLPDVTSGLDPLPSVGDLFS